MYNTFESTGTTLRGIQRGSTPFVLKRFIFQLSLHRWWWQVDNGSNWSYTLVWGHTYICPSSSSRTWCMGASSWSTSLPKLCTGGNSYFYNHEHIFYQVSLLTWHWSHLVKIDIYLFLKLNIVNIPWPKFTVFATNVLSNFLCILSLIFSYYSFTEGGDGFCIVFLFCFSFPSLILVV